MFSNRTSGRGQEEPAQELTNSELHRFLTDVGNARHQLTFFYKGLLQLNAEKENGGGLDLMRVEATVLHYTAEVRRLLGPWDRKPVFGNGVELRLINQSCGLCAGEYSADVLLRGIREAENLDQAMDAVQSSERSLTEIYRRLSGDESNPTMIRSKAQ